jgi:HlyD family secretion protein
MNMSPRSPRPPRAAGRIGWLLLVLLALGACGAVVYYFWQRGDGGEEDVAVFAAKRGPLTINVSRSGTIKYRDLVEIKSEVEGGTQILWLIPEATEVKEGDLLVRLDASKLEDAKIQQQIVLLNSEAALVRTRENLAVTLSQGGSDVSQAEQSCRFAELDLKKYEEGEYPEQVQQFQADITIAEEELQRAEDKLEWSRQLEAEGYITQNELEADELAVKRSQIKLDLARSKLNVLQTFTYQRTSEKLKTDVVQFEEALERTRRRAAANNHQAEAELEARQAEHERQQSKLDKINEQIAKCEIVAPVPGMAIYATTGHWYRGEPLEEGRLVREQEDLIYLPTTASVMVEIMVPESSLRKVKADMPVRVRVEAMPDRIFNGRVGKIAMMPDPYSAWRNPDQKVYATEVYLDEGDEKLRVGMNCQADVVIEEHDDVLYVPVQCVTRVGEQTVVYVQTGREPERRSVEIGLDNNRMVHVIGGLKAGENVLLDPPLAPSEKAAEEEASAGNGQAGSP